MTLNDLAIPDTYCSTSAGSGYQCPDNMTCVTLDDPQRYSSYNVGFNGFDEFGETSVGEREATEDGEMDRAPLHTWTSLVLHSET